MYLLFYFSEVSSYGESIVFYESFNGDLNIIVNEYSLKKNFLGESGAKIKSKLIFSQMMNTFTGCFNFLRFQ